MGNSSAERVNKTVEMDCDNFDDRIKDVDNHTNTVVYNLTHHLTLGDIFYDKVSIKRPNVKTLKIWQRKKEHEMLESMFKSCTDLSDAVIDLVDGADAQYIMEVITKMMGKSQAI